jgi:hypothetical protein
MERCEGNAEPARVFGVDDWNAWLERLASGLFGMSGREFEAAYEAGRLADSGRAQDLGAMLPLIRKLRQRVTP